VGKEDDSTRPAPPDRRDEEDAFARAMADVVPLAPDGRERVRIIPPGRASTARPSPSYSDDDAFARAMADVVPIRQDPRGRVRPIPTAAPELPHAPAAHDDAEEVPHAFVAPGVDRREIRRLKRGAYPVEDLLDLHGFTAAAASAELVRFLETSRHKGHRCVCIVHGRGLHSKEHVSVLRARVRELLASMPAVLAFTDAPAADGGSGAAYVLLRR
jgi:DNA-nicking Smr family endonuclease